MVVVVMMMILVLVLVLAPACYRTYALLTACLGSVDAASLRSNPQKRKATPQQASPTQCSPVGKGWLARTQACVDSYYGRILGYPVLWYRR